MDFLFSTQEELYERVKPALNAKITELHRLGFSYITDIDVWNYLIESKWKKSHNLVLSDIVSDILHADNKKIDLFLKGNLAKTKRSQYFEVE